MLPSESSSSRRGAHLGSGHVGGDRGAEQVWCACSRLNHLPPARSRGGAGGLHARVWQALLRGAHIAVAATHWFQPASRKRWHPRANPRPLGSTVTKYSSLPTGAGAVAVTGAAGASSCSEHGVWGHGDQVACPKRAQSLGRRAEALDIPRRRSVAARADPARRLPLSNSGSAGSTSCVSARAAWSHAPASWPEIQAPESSRERAAVLLAQLPWVSCCLLEQHGAGAERTGS